MLTYWSLIPFYYYLLCNVIQLIFIWWWISLSSIHSDCVTCTCVIRIITACSWFYMEYNLLVSDNKYLWTFILNWSRLYLIGAIINCLKHVAVRWHLEGGLWYLAWNKRLNAEKYVLLVIYINTKLESHSEPFTGKWYHEGLLMINICLVPITWI